MTIKRNIDFPRELLRAATIFTRSLLQLRSGVPVKINWPQIEIARAARPSSIYDEYDARSVRFLTTNRKSRFLSSVAPRFEAHRRNVEGIERETGSWGRKTNEEARNSLRTRVRWKWSSNRGEGEEELLKFPPAREELFPRASRNMSAIKFINFCAGTKAACRYCSRFPDAPARDNRCKFSFLLARTESTIHECTSSRGSCAPVSR